MADHEPSLDECPDRRVQGPRYRRPLAGNEISHAATPKRLLLPTRNAEHHSVTLWHPHDDLFGLIPSATLRTAP